MSGQGSEPGGEPQPTTHQQPQRTAEPSYVDLLTAPLTKRFATFASATGAGTGVGLGVMFLLLKFAGKPAIESPDGGFASQSPKAGEIAATQFVNQAAQLAIYVLPLLAAALAAVLGLYAARRLDVGDRETFVAAAVGGLVGAGVLVVVGTFFVSMGFGSVTVEGQQAVRKPGSVAFGNLVVNAVAVGLGAAVLSTVTSWADRTQA
ncbi:hypothetical protein HALDL1_01570 [Halobacterium sp. DL1]|jgi:hypothetical protein|nr:hypothetical protein HALDL1_01570 [Halobacterium sp. DL1]